MCIIVAKNKNSRLPKKEELQNCFDYNSDGAGFMYVNNNNEVIIDKGYMTWDKFYKQYTHLLKKYNNFKNKSLVMHFRIGTSSGNTPQNTHPYPITKKVNYLHKLYFKTDLGIVHNGIISQYTPLSGKGANINDTQNFIINYLSDLKNNWKSFYKNNDILNGIQKITNSKFTILDKNDNLYFVGEFVNDEGLLFSNSTYKSYNYNYYSSLWEDYYKYDFKKYHKKTEEYKEDKEEFEKQYLIELEPSYFISFESGISELVGERKFKWDCVSYNLYTYDKNNKLELYATNCLAYDENYCELF